MSNNWKKYKLGELIEVKHGYAFKGEFFSERPTKDILLSPGNFNIGGGFKSDKFKYYKGIFPNEYILKENDVIITMTDLSPNGDTLGTTAKIPKPNGVNYLHNQRLGLVIFKSEVIYSDFLYWALRINSYHNFIVASATGSTVKHTSPSRIKEYELNLPPLHEQEAIAEILSSLDDKIELNLQTNKTLEEMANALYKHWFVDFGPFKEGKFVESELGMIPEGWEVVNIGDYVETLGGGTPSTTNEEYWANGDINWYSPTDLTKQKNLFSGNTEKKITNLGLSKSSARLFPSYSLLMSSRATIGLITINTKEACTNQGFITLIPNQKFSLFQLHGWLLQNMELIISKANGSTFKEISKSSFRELRILKAKNLDSYIANVKEIFNLIENNIEENNSLKQTRDYLLPKLISGEIRVKEAEIKVKELL